MHLPPVSVPASESASGHSTGAERLLTAGLPWRTRGPIHTEDWAGRPCATLNTHMQAHSAGAQSVWIRTHSSHGSNMHSACMQHAPVHSSHTNAHMCTHAQGTHVPAYRQYTGFTCTFPEPVSQAIEMKSSSCRWALSSQREAGTYHCTASCMGTTMGAATGTAIRDNHGDKH